MNEVAFVERREPDWQRLKRLCDLGDNSPAQLSPQEFQEFVRLYRRVSGDLAAVRTKSGNDQLANFLNDLVGRAYGILYRTPRGSVGSGLANAISLAARTVRKRKAFVFVSATTFIFAALFAAFLMTALPESRSYFVSPDMEENFNHWKQGHHPPKSSLEGIFATGMYASNNPLASVYAGSVGAATFGVFSFYSLFFNGALVGALSHEVAQVGHLDHLWVSILPHGVTELSGLVLAGAAGLIFGWALINPGRRKRGEALMEEGKDAIVLLAASIVMMYMAAPIEGFFSFNGNVPDIARIIFILVSVAAWAFFWTGYARTPDENSLATPAS